ncbi:hypothetical protein [Zhongshania borealis]|jgi:hypothetical protein|uniref:Uncharacterized protein n=1 Tax=Zhongshania borealis TaxID=889488 RepID=A0ABP7X2J9_9GAMM|tara:strand:- start:254 stop:379 length:126 start_codon:yes stop_codon:yes gene_type:complete
MNHLQTATETHSLDAFAELAAKYSLLTIVAIGVIASFAGLG